MFVPHDFEPPTQLRVPAPSGEVFRLEPLGVEHNARDHRAWTSSIEHIRRSPGYAGRRWPRMMTLEENAADLLAHQEDFTARRGFTYTVLDEEDDVVGCVYIYPDAGDAAAGAHARSWVRADRAALDPVLRRTVADWLRTTWPFTAVTYAGVDT